MKIGIIGSGNIGGALTRRFTALGHEVAVANSRGPESLADLARETGAHASTVEEAVQRAEIIIETIPLRNVPQLHSIFSEVSRDTVIIDTANYYPRQRDGKIAEIESGLPESRWVERQLGHPVVKVFNNIYAEHLLDKGQPAGTPGRIALPISGDDDTAKGKVVRLLDELGFDAVDVGGLDESWRQQPGTPCYGADLDVPHLKEALAAASPARTDDWKA